MSRGISVEDAVNVLYGIEDHDAAIELLLLLVSWHDLADMPTSARRDAVLTRTVNQIRRVVQAI